MVSQPSTAAPVVDLGLLHIDGVWRETSDGATAPTITPIDESAITTIAQATEKGDNCIRRYGLVFYFSGKIAIRSPFMVLTQSFPIDRTKTRHSKVALLGCRTSAVGVMALIFLRAIRPGYVFFVNYRPKLIYDLARQAVKTEAIGRCEEEGQRLGFAGNRLNDAIKTIVRMVLHTGGRVDDLRESDFLGMREDYRRHPGWALRKSAPVLTVRLPCRVRGVHVCFQELTGVVRALMRVGRSRSAMPASTSLLTSSVLCASCASTP